MNATVRAVIEAEFDQALVAELVEAYQEAKKNYHLGGHRLSAVEGGRFCEAAYRMLQQRTTASFTPVGGTLDTEKVAAELGRLSAANHPKSVRIYLPRALRIVYDIRNNRDIAHLADGIDPNFQDATLVVSVLDWVLAEFVRLSGSISANDAQSLVDSLVARELPVVQVFGGFPKVLNPALKAGEHVLVLLYHVGADGASAEELRRWVSPSMNKNLKRTLVTLNSNALVHLSAERVFITFAGQRRVEKAGLLEPVR